MISAKTIDRETSLLNLCPAAYSFLESGSLSLREAYILALWARADQEAFLVTKKKLSKKEIQKSKVKALLEGHLKFVALFEETETLVRIPSIPEISPSRCDRVQPAFAFEEVFERLCRWLGSPYSNRARSR